MRNRLIDRLLRHFGGRCAYCRCELGRWRLPVQEHVIPSASFKRFHDTRSHNIVPSCMDCTTRKGQTAVKKWMLAEGMDFHGFMDLLIDFYPDIPAERLAVIEAQVNHKNVWLEARERETRRYRPLSGLVSQEAR
jgi:hypothetical protein